MTAPDDMIRRGDAIDAMYGKPYGDAVAALLALPADPVAEAAVRFADVIDRAQRQLVTGKPIRLYGLSGPDGEAALDAYRAAVAARDAGTVSLAPAPAPSSGCHNDKPGDPCPCGANFERCPPAGTPPDGIVDPAPACARCGGRGCVPRVCLGTGLVGEDPCPKCRWKPAPAPVSPTDVKQQLQQAVEDPACARCGGAEVLPCPHLREECKRLGHEAKHAPCPECRGKP